MKQLITSAILTLSIFSSHLYASSSSISNENNKAIPTHNIENKKATIANDDAIYFNITMNFESEKCMYSLVKLNADGSIESIGIKNGFKNLNNLPLRYSFTDNTLSDNDVQYVLYRIGSDSELIAQWVYSATDHSINSVELNVDLSECINSSENENSILID